MRRKMWYHDRITGDVLEVEARSDASFDRFAGGPEGTYLHATARTREVLGRRGSLTKRGNGPER